MKRAHLRLFLLITALQPERGYAQETDALTYVGPIRAGSIAEARLVNADLAEIAVPTRVVLRADETLGGFVKRWCQFEDAEFVERLRALNPGISEGAPQPQTLLAQPCARLEPEASIIVREGDSVAAIALRYTGYDGDATQAQIRKLNPQIRALASVDVGDRVTLPYAQREVAVRIAPDADPAKTQAFFTGSGRSLRKVAWALIDSPAELVNEGDIAECTGQPEGWPFEVGPVVALMQRYAREYRRNPEASTVAIVDTGLPPAEMVPALLERLLDRQLPAPLTVDVDGDDYEDDLYGLNLATMSGYPLAPDEYKARDHGLQVAAIASGLAMPGLLDPSRDFVRLKMIGVLTPRETAVAGVSDWGADPHSLAEAVTYARTGVYPPAQILNWSWESNNVDLLVNRLIEEGDELLIAAAGNSGQNLDEIEPRIYPAEYTQRNGTYAIAVAALRPDGKIAAFSNYGAQRVNIAAPGCAIPTFGRDGGPQVVHGTSFAAPLVALTAGILEALGVTKVDQLRSRILVTADRVEELKDKVEEGRRLNVLAALAIYDTVIHPRDLPTCLGRMRTKLQIVSASNILLDGRLARIDIVSRMSDGRVELKVTRRVPRSRDNVVRGYMQDVQLEFTDSSCPALMLSEIKTLIPPQVVGDPVVAAPVAAAGSVPVDSSSTIAR